MKKYKAFSIRLTDIIEDELVSYGAERGLAEGFVKKFWQATDKDLKVLFTVGREFSKFIKL